MNRILFISCLALLSLVPSMTRTATVQTGRGQCVVTQGPDVVDTAPLSATVTMVGGMTDGLKSEGSTVVRFQFIRPDGRALAFLVLDIPTFRPVTSVYRPNSASVSALYYEQIPGQRGEPLYVSDRWEGHFTVANSTSGAGGVEVELDMFFSYTPDGESEELVRTVRTPSMVLVVPGDLSNVSYSYYDDEVHVVSDTVVVFGDGCYGGSDPYDDYYYYPDSDTDYYESPTYYDDYSDDSSCDDGGDYDDSGWDDSSDSSCSGDDSYGDGSSDADCGADDWEEGDGDAGSATALVSARGGRGPGGPGRTKGLGGRLFPFFVLVMALGGLRLLSTRRRPVPVMRTGEQVSAQGSAAARVPV